MAGRPRSCSHACAAPAAPSARRRRLLPLRRRRPRSAGRQRRRHRRRCFPLVAAELVEPDAAYSARTDGSRSAVALVELAHDLGGRAFGREDAEPRARIRLRQRQARLRERRQLRQHPGASCASGSISPSCRPLGLFCLATHRIRCNQYPRPGVTVFTFTKFARARSQGRRGEQISPAMLNDSSFAESVTPHQSPAAIGS